MIRVTRYLNLVAITVVATLTAALPASAVRLPPRDSVPTVGGTPMHQGMSITQVVLVAMCGSLITIALLLAARWARGRGPHGLAHAA